MQFSNLATQVAEGSYQNRIGVVTPTRMRHARDRGPEACRGWSHAGCVRRRPGSGGTSGSTASAQPLAPRGVAAGGPSCHPHARAGLSAQSQLQTHNNSMSEFITKQFLWS